MGTCCSSEKKKPQTLQLWNEAQLNCVSLRSSLDDEGAWRAVKGQDERQKTAPLTALHAPGHSIVDVGEKYMEGRHVGLDFYDLLIEEEKYMEGRHVGLDFYDLLIEV